MAKTLRVRLGRKTPTPLKAALKRHPFSGRAMRDWRPGTKDLPSGTHIFIKKGPLKGLTGVVVGLVPEKERVGAVLAFGHTVGIAFPNGTTGLVSKRELSKKK